MLDRTLPFSNSSSFAGPTPYQPNSYEFGVPYQQMYDQLKSADEALYIRNGVLKMLDRNLRVKTAPERWQDEKVRVFDVAITYEERVYDALVDDMEEKGSKTFQILHVLGLDVRDNHVEAERGAEQTVLLVEMLRSAGEEWEEKLDEIVAEFERRTARIVTHGICFY